MFLFYQTLGFDSYVAEVEIANEATAAKIKVLHHTKPSAKPFCREFITSLHSIGRLINPSINVWIHKIALQLRNEMRQSGQKRKKPSPEEEAELIALQRAKFAAARGKSAAQ
jgi:hypothetical protein